MRQVSQALIDLVKGCEGLKLRAYLCPAGIPTIGWGHTGNVRLGDTITQERADELLAEDLGVAARAVEAAVHVPLTQGQFDALVSFAYNCKGWRTSTLIHLVNSGNMAGAAAEFPKWVHAGTRAEPGLVKRRAAEQSLFLTPSQPA